MSEAVQDILQRIQQLPAEDRLVLDEQLAQLAEAEWQREAEEARRLSTKGEPIPATRLTTAELRKLPREQRQSILARAAELAEDDYRSDKELTGFEAFSEEELDDDQSDSR
jgi:hypothetical protein